MKYFDWRSMMRRILLLATAVLAFINIPANANAQAYTITDLGQGSALAINDSGAVVLNYGALWNNGTFVSLSSGFRPNDINNSGIIAGSMATPDGDRAYTWSSGVFSAQQSLSTQNYDLKYSQAIAINNSNQTLGSMVMPAYVGGGVWRATLWQSGAISSDIQWKTLAGNYPSAQNSNSYGTSLNDLGQVVGYSQLSNGSDWSPFIYSNGKMSELLAGGGVDLRNSRPTHINNLGTVVGDHFHDYGFILANGAFQALKFNEGVSSSALSLNDSNIVVGTAAVSDVNQPSHAFLFDGQTMLDLSLLPEVIASGWTTLYSANDINNEGQIVGVGVINGEQHAFLLSPIPEPETYALFLAGLGLIGAMAWHRKRAIA